MQAARTRYANNRTVHTLGILPLGKFDLHKQFAFLIKFDLLERLAFLSKSLRNTCRLKLCNTLSPAIIDYQPPWYTWTSILGFLKSLFVPFYNTFLHLVTNIRSTFQLHQVARSFIAAMSDTMSKEKPSSLAGSTGDTSPTEPTTNFGDGHNTHNVENEKGTVATETTEPVSPRKVHGIAWFLVVTSILMANFLFAMDNTVAANIQPAVVKAFHSLDKLVWLPVAFFASSWGTNFLWYVFAFPAINHFNADVLLQGRLLRTIQQQMDLLL